MQKIVSFKSLEITGPIKAIIRKKENSLEVEPKKDFWSLAGLLKSDVKLSDTQLRETREAFTSKWSR